MSFDDIRVEASPLAFFETPVAVARLTGAQTLIDELKRVIQSRREAHPGLRRSNEGGWHSDTDMMDWGGAGAAKLAELAIRIAKRMSHFQGANIEDFDWLIQMWANVSPPEALNHLHAHPGNLWAAVFYLDMGDEDANREDGVKSDIGGALYLEDPRFPMIAMRHTGFRLMSVPYGPTNSKAQPQAYQADMKFEAGDLVVFPAWLRHGVRRYTGSSERVSVALNLDVREKRPGRVRGDRN